MAGKLFTVTLTLPDGKRKYFRGKTKEEAEAKRNEARMLLGMGINIGDKTTVAELSETWFTIYKKGQVREKSEDAIRNTLTHHILPALGRMKVVDVKPIHIQQLMASKREFSRSLQAKVLQTTRAIFEVAVENGIILRTPVSKSIKAGGKPPEEKTPLTKAQMAALLNSLTGTRAHPLVMLLCYSGLRIGEALGLQWNDFDFTDGTVTVNRSIVYTRANGTGEINTDLKTANAHRTVPLPWSVVDEFRRERAKSKSIWVFTKADGGHHTYRSYRSLWELVNRRCDPNSKVSQRDCALHVHPHLLRHTCITRWFEQGLDIKEIQRLAGHANANITLNIYTHYVDAERLQQTAEKIRAAV